MTFQKATDSYEAWLGGCCVLDADGLDDKHAKMRKADDPFGFFRGSYYRWAQLWPGVCGDLAAAPSVLAVGDLHVENFGTWRDGDGRLCWGVNDFDEADELPYAHDLVRLAASVLFARASRKTGGLDLVKFKPACAAILAGYDDTLRAGGDPFVLEERHAGLRALSIEVEPVAFWAKEAAVLDGPAADPPEAARAALTASLPAAELAAQFRRRRPVGVGSLGKPRYVALAQWGGGWVARDAKAVTPPATAWASGVARSPRGAELAAKATRCPDPFYRVGPEWVTRRVAPHCARVELPKGGTAAQATELLRAMGAEAANVHRGGGDAEAIRADLAARPADWLADAAKAMGAATTADGAAWRG